MPIDKLSANAFATGAVANSLGYTPANKAGDTFTGNVVFSANATVTGAAAFSNTVAMGSDYLSPYMGFKNRIINGAMVIDQRNAGASVSPNTSTDVFPCDRFAVQASQNSKCTAQQVTTAPTGFKTSLKITSSSAYSVGVNDYFDIYHKIEGYNVADMAFGTANAVTFTLSFWVQCSLTGTFGGSVYNNAFNRSYPFSYTISSANTWEYKTVTITGDTSGTWTTDNTSGLGVGFGLGVGTNYSSTAGAWTGSGKFSATGATSVVGTSGATFYITGVQVEKGSTATAFDYRPVGSELQLCQRYYEKSYNQEYVPGTFNVGWDGTSTNGTSFAEGPGPRFKVSKRTNPTVVIYNAVSGATARMYQVSTAASITVALRNIGHNGVGIVDYTSSGGQNSYYFQWTANAEL